MSNNFSRFSVPDYLNDPEMAFEYIKVLEEEITAQAKRIEELEKEINCWHEAANWPEKSPLQLRSRIAELEHQLKVECDTYLWKRKLMSRRIAFLQGWMQKLFKYCSSPEARRNQMTMTTEIPDYLMREGEDLLLETATSENGDD